MNNWISNFLDKAKELIGVDCSCLVQFVSKIRDEGYEEGYNARLKADQK